MKVLIIGSQGFIGRHVYEFFSRKAEACGADVVNTLGQKNFFLLDEKNTDFTGVFKGQGFDVCVNASGNGNVSKSVQDPLFDYRLNVLNTLYMLESIRNNNTGCRFVNLSSAAVYGNPAHLPVSEDDFPAPISPYGYHKLAAERLCDEYFRLYGLGTVSLRIFSVYGEFLQKQLFWDIYQKTLQSSNIQLFGTGEESRDFIYISDLLSALDTIISRAAFHGEVINIASGSETSIRKAAELFCKNIDSAIKVTFTGNSKQGDPLKWSADISRLRIMGFVPRVPFEEGIKNVARWISEKK
jgi:UDP-glucose 4-epimerase